MLNVAKRGSHLNWRKHVKLLTSLLLLAITVVWITPLIFSFFTSFKSTLELKKFIKLKNILPMDWTLDNYRFILNYGAAPLPSLTMNSFIVAIAQVILVLFISSTSAYAYERLEFRGKETLFWTLFGLSMIPFVISLVPQYMLYSYIGWADHLICLITPYLGNVFYIFLLRNFLKGVPKALDEAARIDGATDLQIYAKIIVPSIYPAMTVVALFTFSSAWNDMMWPSLAITSAKRLTLTAGIRLVNDAFNDGVSGRPERVLAACMLAMIPTLVVYLFARRYFLQGLSLSAGIKG